MEMDDWIAATERLRLIFSKKARKIRSDIPSNEIAEEATKALFAGITDEEGSLKMDGSGLASLISRINGDHKDRIVRLAQEVGTILNYDDRGSGTFAGEDGDGVLMRTDGLLVRIRKETALKILMLGEIP